MRKKLLLRLDRCHGGDRSDETVFHMDEVEAVGMTNPIQSYLYWTTSQRILVPGAYYQVTATVFYAGGKWRIKNPRGWKELQA